MLARRITQPTGHVHKTTAPTMRWNSVDRHPFDENNSHPEERTRAARNEHWNFKQGAPPPMPSFDADVYALWRETREKLGQATGPLCWCGELAGHPWPGKEQRRPHP